MKKLTSLATLVATLFITLATSAQTVIFNDTFGSSTLNPTATSPGTITSTRTAYEIASAKNATTTTLTGNALTLSTASTSSGFTEAQALFTTTPVTLSAPGQSIEVYFTFKDTANLLNGSANNGTGPYLGLFNSGGSGPTNGTALWNSGIAGALTTATNQAAAGWAGYVGNFIFNSNTAASSSAIAARPPQTMATSNLCQELLFASSYLFKTNITTMAGVTNQPTLTSGNMYTMDLQIAYANANAVTIRATLYNGVGTNGSIVSGTTGSSTFTAVMTGTATNTTAGTPTGPVFTYDALAVGYRAGAPAVVTLNISNIVVLTYIPAAPTITGLTNQTVVQGSSTTLNPTITGTPAPAYQWQTNGVNIDGATSATLVLTSVQYAQNGYVYSLIATNSMGAFTNSLTLSVLVPPSISGLSDQAVSVGNTASLNPTVSGVPSPTFQWRYNGANLADGLTVNGSTIAGSTGNPLDITNAQSADSGTYSLVASNSAGMVTNSMYLTVGTGDVLPILTGPTNLTVIQGNNATFSATVSGVPVPTLQWLDQTGAPITAATNNILVLSGVLYSQNGYVYSLVASNSVGNVTNSATLTVIVPPVITSQPAGLTVTNTEAASFTVVATGVPNPTFQWYKNGSPISSGANNSATNATLNLATTAPADSGSTYYAQISNSAGSTNSATVTLTVNSTITTTAFTPTNSAAGLCYDTPLSVTFSAVPSLGTTGNIKIYNVTNSATPVDTISVTNSVQQRTFPGDGQSFSYKTIVISGSTVTLYPHFNVLSSNQTYYVTIDTGAFTDPAGANFVGLTATNVWQFSTKVGGPVDANNLVVNQDGSGDFLTVQGAVNSVPSGNTTPRVINVRNGTYTELVDIAGRNNLTLRGQSRLGTLIGYPNNATFQTANNGTTHARMAVKVGANDIAFDNLTITNMTPQGGSQAEALMIETSAARCIVNNADVVSRQDTILANTGSSQAYFYNSAVRGNFDFIWGGGNLYFDKCSIQNIAGTGSGNISAARTGTSASSSTNYPWLNPGGTYTANGVSFVNCKFTADTGVGSVTLAGANGSSGNNVSWFGCDFTTNYIAPSASLFSGNFVFWQSANTMTNSPVTFAVLISISGSDPRLLAATNIPTWFYGWSPSLAPNILTNPVGQTVNYASPTTFSVVATGIPDPTYQWQHAGTNLPGATSSTLTIASATTADGGAYAAVVTTSAGSVTSSSATLTVNPPVNTAPTFTAPISGTNLTINPGVSLAVACTATDADSPAQTLTYALLTGPTNAAVNSGTGSFIWRPTTAQANFTNTISVVVTDNGTPNLSATNTFTVTVNPLAAPAAAAVAYAGGQFSVSISGQVGLDYYLQANTNLTSGTWTTVASTNSPATLPVILADPGAGAQPMQFYRIVVGPPAP